MAVSAQGQEPAGIGLTGGPDALWIHVRQGEGAAASLRFAVLRHQTGREESFRLVPLGPVGGQIRMAAACGGTLHVFFADGSHRSVPPQVLPPQFGEPAAALEMEVDLPGKSELPAAVTGDAATARLWAVVSNHVALQIDELEARLRRDEAGGRDDDTVKAPPQDQPAAESAIPKPPETAAAAGPEGAPTLSKADFVLVYYDGGRWRTDRDLPLDVTVDASDVRLAARNGHVALTYRPAGAESHVITVSPGAGEAWSAPRPVAEAAATAATAMALAFMGDAPAVVLDDPASPMQRFSVTGLRDDGWTDARPLSLPGGAEAPWPARVAAAFFADQVALAALDDPGRLMVGRWAASDGSNLSPWARVDAFAPVPFARVRQWIGHAIEFGLVIVLLGVLYLRRHDSTLAAIPLQRGQLLAPLSARAAAFVLDAVIVAPLLAGVFLALKLPITPEQIRALAGDDDGLPGGKVWWMLIAVSGTFAAYATVFEAALGATLGKRILGLRVVVAGGGRVSLRAALVRNVLRVVDFEFPPALFLVLLTLNRQRLGDVMARTVVVTQTVEAEKPSEAKDGEAAADDEPPENDDEARGEGRDKS